MRYFPDPDHTPHAEMTRPILSVGQCGSNKRNRSCSSSPTLKRSGKRKCDNGSFNNLSTEDLAQCGYEVEQNDRQHPGPLDVVQISGRFRATIEYEPAYITELSEALGLEPSSNIEADIPHPHQGSEVSQLIPVSHADGSNRSDQHLICK